MKPKKKPKMPKLRIPTPPSDRAHADRKKETSRNACRVQTEKPAEDKE